MRNIDKWDGPAAPLRWQSSLRSLQPANEPQLIPKVLPLPKPEVVTLLTEDQGSMSYRPFATEAPPLRLVAKLGRRAYYVLTERTEAQLSAPNLLK